MYAISFASVLYYLKDTYSSLCFLVSLASTSNSTSSEGDMDKRAFLESNSNGNVVRKYLDSWLYQPLFL